MVNKFIADRHIVRAFIVVFFCFAVFFIFLFYLKRKATRKKCDKRANAKQYSTIDRNALEVKYYGLSDSNPFFSSLYHRIYQKSLEVYNSNDFFFASIVRMLNIFVRKFKKFASHYFIV